MATASSTALDAASFAARLSDLQNRFAAFGQMEKTNDPHQVEIACATTIELRSQLDMLGAQARSVQGIVAHVFAGFAALTDQLTTVIKAQSGSSSEEGKRLAFREETITPLQKRLNDTFVAAAEKTSRLRDGLQAVEPLLQEGRALILDPQISPICRHDLSLLVVKATEEHEINAWEEEVTRVKKEGTLTDLLTIYRGLVNYQALYEEYRTKVAELLSSLSAHILEHFPHSADLLPLAVQVHPAELQAKAVCIENDMKALKLLMQALTKSKTADMQTLLQPLSGETKNRLNEHMRENSNPTACLNAIPRVLGVLSLDLMAVRVRQNDGVGLCSLLDKLTPSRRNELYGLLFTLHEKAQYPFPARDHVDYGRVGFREEEGFSASPELKLQAIQALRARM